MTLTGAAKRGHTTREQILDQAVEIFAQQGYRGGSLRDIAARCGVGHSALLYHFPTKEKLLLAVLERREISDGQAVQMMQAVGIDALAAWVRLAELNTTRRGIVELFSTIAAEATWPDHPAHEFFIARYQAARRNATYAYQQADDAAALAPGIDPATAGAGLIAIMDGLQIQWLLDPHFPMAAQVRAHIQAQITVPLP